LPENLGSHSRQQWRAINLALALERLKNLLRYRLGRNELIQQHQPQSKAAG
jgi:hypothetical protein